MIVTPIEHDLDLFAGSPQRSPGLHLSDIYGPLYEQLAPKQYRGRSTGPDPLKDAYITAGLSLESMMEEGLKRRMAERPGEFRTPEGIIFSPDLLIYNHALRLGEIKLTWMSSREVPRHKGEQFPAKFDKYFTQMKGYCHNLDTNLARLYTFHVNGTYRPMTPELLAWDIEFSARELHENWQMLMNFARERRML